MKRRNYQARGLRTLDLTGDEAIIGARAIPTDNMDIKKMFFYLMLMVIKYESRHR